MKLDTPGAGNSPTTRKEINIVNKYYFAHDGEVKFYEHFENDSQAFAHRCKLEKRDGRNWKVYNERLDLVYGLMIAR